jgi:UDP:flavonoid glycosyltransferase YjiC (YdhE family)
MTWRAVVLTCGALLLTLLASVARASSGLDLFPVIEADHPDLPKPRRHHVVLVTIPLYGHFMPMKAIAEALLERGHAVTILTEKESWCETPLKQKFGCVKLPPSGAFPPEMLQFVSGLDDIGESFLHLFDQILNHQQAQLGNILAAVTALNASSDPAQRPTAVLTDASTLAGYDVAAKFNLPYAVSFPMVLRLPLSPDPSLPSVGLGYPRDMTFGQRLFNYFIGLVVPFKMLTFYYAANAVRAKHGVPPYKNILDVQGLYAPIFAPTVWPYDIPQPLCPNIFPLGTYLPAHTHIAMEADLQSMLESEHCKQHGAVYVNFGTLSTISPRLLKELLTAFTAEDFQQCIVWKPNSEYMDEVTQTFRDRGMLGTRACIKQFFANPPGIMLHPSLKTFITHCGDTSVCEAIEASLPLIGIPFFAAQGDVCQRVGESGIGRYIGHKAKVTAADVTSAIVAHSTNTTLRGEMKQRFAQLHAVAKHLGGAPRGAQVAEAHFNYQLVKHLSCSHVDPVRLGTVDPVTGEVNTGLFAQMRAVWLSQNYDVLFLFNLIPMWIAFALVHYVLRRVWRRLRGGSSSSSSAPAKEKQTGKKKGTNGKAKPE